MSHSSNYQGQGIVGRYAGLSDQFAELDHSQIVIVPVPFDLTTTYQHGTEKGPAALIEASRNLELYDIETASEVYEQGIYTAPPIQAYSCSELQTSLQKEVTKFLNLNKFVVSLGGEHSISYAPIQAHCMRYPNLSILQLDAHADLQEAYEGNPWSHASAMARVLELPIVNLVAVGIRSMSSEEILKQQTVTTFFSHQLFENDEWMQKAIEKLSENVYLTFDLDVFDSSIMPSTGTPEPGGMNWHQVTKFLKLVAQQRNLVGFDVVELCPSPTNLAPDYLAAKLVYKILSYKFTKE